MMCVEWDQTQFLAMTSISNDVIIQHAIFMGEKWLSPAWLCVFSGAKLNFQELVPETFSVAAQSLQVSFSTS